MKVEHIFQYDKEFYRDMDIKRMIKKEIIEKQKCVNNLI